MTGRWEFRGFRLLLPAAVAGALLALPGTSILAQEVDVPEAEELAETAEGVASDFGDQAVIDLEGLSEEELRRLCQTRPELQAKEECREALQTLPNGKASRGSPPSTATSSAVGGPVSEERISASEGPASRGQSTAGRPRIVVQKTNDADGNGVFTRDELASKPGDDVPFRVMIRNMGPRAVTIETVTDSYDFTNMEVCTRLVGHRVPPRKSARCSFTLENYAPPHLDSQANTVEVTVEEARGRRRASDSDISTVTTLGAGGEQVRGRRETGPGSADGTGAFAYTGSYLDRMMSLAGGLVVAGTLLLRLARRRPIALARPDHAPTARPRRSTGTNV